MDNSAITTIRPYLIRAFYNWLLDNQLTPYLLVDTNVPKIEVPLVHTTNGQIILNIEPNAIKNLHLGNKYVSFNARFNGVVHYINVPVTAVLAIYASENGIGTIFDSHDELLSEKNLNVQKDIKMSLIDNEYHVNGNKDTKKISEDKVNKKFGNKTHPNLRIIK
ncbi:ClpXP protease specificity-enhancing factor [Candidatus Pantoea edessiphila]|uniref:ClpXP protease specificity-enhancing factor n=1 Tax=Candidatus Pantoea edessiphila TaxID=2044610 RepID=A0A2P5T005_9GAMM|nr:ClpXP protease specificity-enhancing factor [Candidatus Pantoea edessiphila]PPI87917.1 ClpXP protease specificity-enhancing factor [Candidatus Pantoea edessiphila]